MAMMLRPMGATGLEVTPIGLGLAALGRPAYIDLGRDEDLGDDRSPDVMEQRAHALLDVAYAAGVRYVDAARSYGRAEEFLASWLDLGGARAHDLTIGSKWGYTYVGNWRMHTDVHEVKDHTLAALRRQLAESQELLGDRLDLYQIHSATFESGVLEDRAVLAELATLGAEGLVVGMSVSGPEQAATIERALEVEVDGVQPFRSVQATWNLLEPSAGPALAAAHDAGWGVIVKEAMANGRLASSSGDQPSAGPIDSVAGRHGVTPDQVALAAALARPWSDVVLSGAVTSGQLESNLGAVSVALSSEDLHELGSVAEAPDTYWRTRGSLAWS
jgi:aryl-alcohol dehydrogenase-like predicted oxidoreductase